MSSTPVLISILWRVSVVVRIFQFDDEASVTVLWYSAQSGYEPSPSISCDDDHSIKKYTLMKIKSLNKKIYFNEKYDKEIFIELCDLLGYQMEKVTKTYEILYENDINTVLDEIQKNIESNHEKISTDSKKK